MGSRPRHFFFFHVYSVRECLRAKEQWRRCCSAVAQQIPCLSVRDLFQHFVSLHLWGRLFDRVQHSGTFVNLFMNFEYFHLSAQSAFQCVQRLGMQVRCRRYAPFRCLRGMDITMQATWHARDNARFLQTCSFLCWRENSIPSPTKRVRKSCVMSGRQTLHR